MRPPWWPSAVGLALCGLGFGVSGYLTYEYYAGSTSLSCPSRGGFIFCLGVTNSLYNSMHGVSVAVLGLVFFAAMAAVQSPPAWRSQQRQIRTARVVWSLIGVATALTLFYDELFKLDEIWLWSTFVHVLSLLLFIVTVLGTLATTASYPLKSRRHLQTRARITPAYHDRARHARHAYQRHLLPPDDLNEI